MPTDERVLGVPAARLTAWGTLLGFRPATAIERDELLGAGPAEFRPRSRCETDPTFLQFIPYVVLTCGDLVFHYRRGAAGTEARLRSLRSVGIGGHVSEADAADGQHPYFAGLAREVAEEVAVGPRAAEHFLGFVHDGRTPVGQVHLGLVHQWVLESPDAVPREAALVEAGWSPRAELLAAGEAFEMWSRFVLPELR